MFKNIILISSVALIAASCNSSPNLYNDAKGNIAGRTLSLDVVTSQAERATGLGGRTSINDGQGMLFLFEYSDKHSFWMKGMNFDIDIIWLQDNKIVEIAKNVKAEPGVPDERLKRYTPGSSANAVLEIRAGWSDANNLKPGDRLEVKY